MDDSNPANCTEDPEYPDNYDGEIVEESFELTWKNHIERARTGDTGATRAVMHTCICFLKGLGWALNPKDWDSRIPIDTKGYSPAGYVPEPLCSFLINTLETAMSAKKREVGEVMGMGVPPKTFNKKTESAEFLNYYSSTVNGEHPVKPSRHTEAIESIATRKNLHKDTVQRYWTNYFESYVDAFGLPPPKYAQYMDVYEDLATIINNYQSLINTPVRNGNTTRPPVYSFILKKIASQTGKDFSVVEQYLNIFLSEAGNPDEDLLDEFVTFIDRYNSLVNSPHFEDEAALPQRRKEALNQIAVYMDRDLPSVERYLEVFERAAENIKASPITDEDEDTY